MRSVHVGPCLILVGAVLALSSVLASAQRTTVYHYTGDGAAAYFSDMNGCIATSVSVEFGESTAGSPPHPAEQPTFLYMYVTSWDTCTGSGWSVQTDPPALLDPGAAAVSNTLRSASVNATVNLTDGFNNFFPAEVSLTWTGTDGPLTKTIDRAHYISPYGFNNADTRSMSREATAMGTVMMNGFNVLASPGQGWIEKEIRGSITIVKK